MKRGKIEHGVSSKKKNSNANPLSKDGMVPEKNTVNENPGHDREGCDKRGNANIGIFEGEGVKGKNGHTKRRETKNNRAEYCTKRWDERFLFLERSDESTEPLHQTDRKRHPEHRWRAMKGT